MVAQHCAHGWVHSPRGEMLLILITKRKCTGCNGRKQPCCTPLLWQRAERLITFN